VVVWVVVALMPSNERDRADHREEVEKIIAAWEKTVRVHEEAMHEDRESHQAIFARFDKLEASLDRK
jgi:hypothetical protein